MSANALQAPGTADSNSTEAALTVGLSPELHSTQVALGGLGLLDSTTVTTTSTPVLAAPQNSPTTTQISPNPAGPSQPAATATLDEAEVPSAVPAVSTYLVMTNPSLGVGGPGIVIQTTSASTKASTLVTLQSGSSAITVMPTSSSQLPGQNGAAAQSTATTGDYALTVGPNGDVGLQFVSTTSAQAVTPTSRLPLPLTGPVGTSSIPAGPGPAAISVGSNQSVGSRPLWPLPTGFKSGTLAGNGTRRNSSDVLPYLGVATRDRSQGLRWLICMTSAALLAAL